jgi:Protein of unknown function (DUF2550)
MEAVEIVGVIVLLACALLFTLVVRRRVLDRRGGTVDLSWRQGRSSGVGRNRLGWSFGVGRYEGDRLLWFKTFSLALRPQHVLRRSSLVIGPRRRPHGAEIVAVIADATVVECTHEGERFELAVPSAALPGLLAWVEAAPRVSSRREPSRASS